MQPRTLGEEITVADVNKVRSKVQQFLVDGTGSVSVDEDGDFILEVDSSRAFIRVLPHPNGEAVLVICFAQILHDVPASPEFFKYVATNDEYIFGSLTAAEQPDGKYLLIMRQTLLGDSLAEDALLYSAFGVLAAANELDEQLAAEFGGKVFGEQ